MTHLNTTLERRTHYRLNRESLLARARHLSPTDRALIQAHLEFGMALDEIAILHRLTRRQARRRLDHLSATLSDPFFMLTVEFAPQLPPPLCSIAYDYWLSALPLRQIARRRQLTLHRVRSYLDRARSLLLIAKAAHQLPAFAPIESPHPLGTAP
jgi:hypothetical protein